MKIARVNFTTADGSWIKAGTVINDNVDLTGCVDLVDELDINVVDVPKTSVKVNDDIDNGGNDDGDIAGVDGDVDIHDVTENKMISKKQIKSKSK